MTPEIDFGAVLAEQDAGADIVQKVQKTVIANPWDDSDTPAPTHNEATVSINTRIEMPTEGDDIRAIWQITVRSGFSYDDLAAAIDAMTFIHGTVSEAGGSMHDIVVGGVTVNAAANAAARVNSVTTTADGKVYDGPGQWDAEHELAYTMVKEVSLDFTNEDGTAYVRAYDGVYFEQYGLPIYADSKKGIPPVEFYGLQQVISQGRPKVRFPLSSPLKVWFWSKIDEDGKVKPIKAVVPFALDEIAEDKAPKDGRPKITPGR